MDAEQPALDGDYVTCHTGLAAFPTPKVDIGLGVLRPGMARLAGHIADVAITWLTPAAYLRDTVIPALRAGAESAGRPVPRGRAFLSGDMPELAEQLAEYHAARVDEIVLNVTGVCNVYGPQVAMEEVKKLLVGLS
ncbi:LLM class flavin-dependent oxidoreductase [Streptomyces platensis]|uniref:LLM class flavin-dependent oxidoreductase n=1 Tax=Streptomyces platensis TaxID=58346 RepID=UPI003330D92C